LFSQSQLQDKELLEDESQASFVGLQHIDRHVDLLQSVLDWQKGIGLSFEQGGGVLPNLQREGFFDVCSKGHCRFDGAGQYPLGESFGKRVDGSWAGSGSWFLGI
jgi:hypothetical protein